MTLNAKRVFGVAAMTVLLTSLEGCTTRSLTVTTNPPGAEVSVNYRVIGKSPIRVGFTHYGVYRIEIRREKYETLVREETINPPIYGYDPITAIADNAIPARLNDDIYLHYVLKPVAASTEQNTLLERNSLLERADAAKNGVGRNAKGESVQLAYSRPPKTAEQIAKDAKAKEEAAKAAAEAAAKTNTIPGSDPTKPVIDPFKIKVIEEKEPEGPKISKDLNIKPVVPEKKPDATKTIEAPKKETGPVRTPKSEELIFEKPDAPKPDAPKK